ncbi:MAG: cell division topological specificity factor [Chloroflexi bacterium OLB15]|nr:MAG: cell division topological specificity factor [Chloroflexi bacterium OLB15]
MPSLIDRMLGRTSKTGTGSKAKERLQFILIHDRINLPPERLEAMKAEILQVISKYVSVDSSNVDIALQNRERTPAIVAEIPFNKTVEGDDPDEDEPPKPPKSPLKDAEKKP